MPLFGSGKKDLYTLTQELNDETGAQMWADALMTA